MSKIVSVYGASDDLIEWDGCDGADEFNVYNPSFGEFLLESLAESEVMVVIVEYTDLGSWSIALAPWMTDDGEGVPMPSWPMSWAQPTGCPDYSAHLTIECPDDVTLTRLDGNGFDHE